MAAAAAMAVAVAVADASGAARSAAVPPLADHHQALINDHGTTKSGFLFLTNPGSGGLEKGRKGTRVFVTLFGGNLAWCKLPTDTLFTTGVADVSQALTSQSDDSFVVQHGARSFEFYSLDPADIASWLKAIRESRDEKAPWITGFLAKDRTQSWFVLHQGFLFFYPSESDWKGAADQQRTASVYLRLRGDYTVTAVHGMSFQINMLDDRGQTLSSHTFTTESVEERARWMRLLSYNLSARAPSPQTTTSAPALSLAPLSPSSSPSQLRTSTGAVTSPKSEGERGSRLVHGHSRHTSGSTSVLRTGWLILKHQRRFVVAKEKRLLWFNDQPANNRYAADKEMRRKKTAGSISIASGHAPPALVFSSHVHVYILSADGRPYVFKAPNDEEANEWCQVLKGVVERRVASASLPSSSMETMREVGKHRDSKLGWVTVDKDKKRVLHLGTSKLQIFNQRLQLKQVVPLADSHIQALTESTFEVISGPSRFVFRCDAQHTRDWVKSISVHIIRANAKSGAQLGKNGWLMINSKPYWCGVHKGTLHWFAEEPDEDWQSRVSSIAPIPGAAAGTEKQHSVVLANCEITRHPTLKNVLDLRAGDEFKYTILALNEGDAEDWRQYLEREKAGKAATQLKLAQELRLSAAQGSLLSPPLAKPRPLPGAVRPASMAFSPSVLERSMADLARGPEAANPHAVFHLPLDAIKSRDALGVPFLVRDCLDYLDKPGVYEIDSLFITSASNVSHVQELVAAYESGSPPRLASLSPPPACRDVAVLLRHFFRNLPAPVIPYDLREFFLEARTDVALLRVLCTKLPPSNAALLRTLCNFLSVLALESPHESNSAVNLATLFAPLLLRKEGQLALSARSKATNSQDEVDLLKAVLAVGTLISHFDEIFQAEAVKAHLARGDSFQMMLNEFTKATPQKTQKPAIVWTESMQKPLTGVKRRKRIPLAFVKQVEAQEAQEGLQSLDSLVVELQTSRQHREPSPEPPSVSDSGTSNTVFAEEVHDLSMALTNKHLAAVQQATPDSTPRSSPLSVFTAAATTTPVTSRAYRLSLSLSPQQVTSALASVPPAEQTQTKPQPQMAAAKGYEEMPPALKGAAFAKRLAALRTAATNAESSSSSAAIVPADTNYVDEVDMSTQVHNPKREVPRSARSHLTPEQLQQLKDQLAQQITGAARPAAPAAESSTNAAEAIETLDELFDELQSERHKLEETVHVRRTMKRMILNRSPRPPKPTEEQLTATPMAAPLAAHAELVNSSPLLRSVDELKTQPAPSLAPVRSESPPRRPLSPLAESHVSYGSVRSSVDATPAGLSPSVSPSQSRLLYPVAASASSSTGTAASDAGLQLSAPVLPTRPRASAPSTLSAATAASLPLSGLVLRSDERFAPSAPLALSSTARERAPRGNGSSPLVSQNSRVALAAAAAQGPLTGQLLVLNSATRKERAVRVHAGVTFEEVLRGLCKSRADEYELVDASGALLVGAVAPFLLALPPGELPRVQLRQSDFLE